MLLAACGFLFPGCARVPFYPVGLWGVTTTNHLDTAHRGGFNAVVGGPGADYLKHAAELDLKVLAYPGTQAGEHFSAATVRKNVRQFDSSPALWAWYICDEPDLNGISPTAVRNAHRFLKSAGAKKPTAIALSYGSDAATYGNIADLTMLDRYPIGWAPLATFNQHLQMARLSVGPEKPLIAIIQAFDWTGYPLMSDTSKKRAPNAAEIKCMSYCALLQRATGIFYYTLQDSNWNIENHPDTWKALTSTVAEINARLPLFQAKHLWWPIETEYSAPAFSRNEVFQSAVGTALVRVSKGNAEVSEGDYFVAVNTTANVLGFSIHAPKQLPEFFGALGEPRAIQSKNGWIQDQFEPYAVHVYGPLPPQF